MEHGERLDLLIHLLARLPAQARLTLYGDGPARPQLEQLAQAYGLSDGVDFDAMPSSLTEGTIVFPSRANAARAASTISGGAQRILLDDGAGPRSRERPGSEESVFDCDRTVDSMGSLLAAVAPDGGPAPADRADPELLSGERVAVLTNYPTHYRLPLFNALAARLDGAGAELRVLFTDPNPGARAWMRGDEPRFEREFLSSRRVPVVGGDLPADLERRLDAHRPTILLAGGFSPLVAGRGARFARSRRIPFGIWSGETEYRPTARGIARGLQRRRLLGRADFAVAYGFRAGEYLRRLAPRLPFVHARNTTPFPEPRRFGEDGPVEVLTVSRAIPGKGLDLLVEAFLALDPPGCRLTIAGDGPELDSLRRAAAGDERVRLLGSVPTDRVADLFRSADVFAFPSSIDAFGLVLVEAFAAGLAVAVAPEPGAVGDLAVTRAELHRRRRADAVGMGHGAPAADRGSGAARGARHGGSALGRGPLDRGALGRLPALRSGAGAAGQGRAARPKARPGRGARRARVRAAGHRAREPVALMRGALARARHAVRRRLHGEAGGLAKDTVYVGIWQGATTAADFAQIPLLTYFLGLEAYGQFALVIAAVTFVGQFLNPRVGIAAVTHGSKAWARHPREAAGVFQLTFLIDLATGMLAFVVVLGIAPGPAPIWSGRTARWP